MTGHEATSPATLQRLPRIALTAGDPAGIGPEIIAKAAIDPAVRAVCDPIIFEEPPNSAVVPGQVSAAAGEAAFTTIVRAVEAARRGDIDGIATAPINKLAFAKAGLPWKGHTDLLAHLCGTDQVAMMFHSAPLKVVLLTVHVPLQQVASLLSGELVDRTIALTVAAMARFGMPAPRLALAGLNPHAGEGGVIGSEDDRVLAPAVARARQAGVNIDGPIPGDTVFVRASRGEFDCVIACYHDQGLIPVKLLAFGHAVNVTIGLPIIRTSVDHGTAFDIAGKGIADPGSMIAAVKLAAALASRSIR
ncbi:MAG TPA: 4-hydroxythreonine-4-phosphate dehydrogenase PdxA [Vicinamibacterales bacterium]|nr:4-hydroxythreonine-4-phosphate dehydrogenase PdxA [Vicinamibacterales bacterium]